jgi:hypothetical protein
LVSDAMVTQYQHLIRRVRSAAARPPKIREAGDQSTKHQDATAMQAEVVWEIGLTIAIVLSIAVLGHLLGMAFDAW